MFSKISGLLLVIALCVGAYFWYKYKIPKYIVGEIAPDFTATLADGKTVKLSDLKGKYVILQFWGSWCGPCRKENPELVRLYQKYNAAGLEIFSVGIEQNEARWRKAMEQDGMVWPYHTIELGDFNGPIGKMYGVLQIPSVWLINPEGMIIGTNPRSEEMDKVLGAKIK